MRNDFIETRNYSNLYSSVAKLESLPLSAPRIGLGYGNFGLGKTLSLEMITANKNALLLRAAQTWSKKSVLEKICLELNLDIGGGNGRMYERIIDDLCRKPRMIIVDEIDALLRVGKIEVLELFRDIHDETPIVLYFIGMEEAHGKMKRHRHYYSRIVELVEFKAIQVDDIRTYCSLSDVTIEEDLMQFFASKYPNLRQIKVLIIRLEQECALNDIQSASLKIFKSLGIENGGK